MEAQGKRIGVPRHPFVMHAVLIAGGFGVAFILITFSVGVANAWPVAVLALLVSVPTLMAIRTAVPVQHVNSAVNALSAGRIETAEAHIAEAERSHAGLIRISTNLLRAAVSLQRAELARSLEYLDTALAVRLPWLGRFNAKLNAASALAHRALVHALRGDEAAVRTDLDALESLSDKRVDALAYAALARAVLLHRAGDAGGLRQHLDQNRALLVEATAPRLRALVRALRWSTGRAHKAYRTPAVGDPSAVPQGIDAWIDTVLPGASDLAQDPLDDVEQSASAAPGEPTRSAGLAAIAAAQPPLLHIAPPAPRRAKWKILAPWLVLIVAFLAIWQFLSGDPQAPEPAPEPARPALNWAIMVGPLVFTVAVFIMFFVRGKRAQAELLRATRLMATSPEAAGESFARVTRSNLKQIAAQAHLMLASLAERAADFPAVLAHADAALAQLRSLGMRALSYDMLLPDIHALRALAFAGLDRASDAASELARVEREFPTYYMLERARVRVEQLLAVRAGDFQTAARVATQRSPDLPISYRDDVLGEIATLVSRGTVGRTRLSRLQHELECDPLLSHWLDVTAPDLMAQFGRLKAA